MSVQDVLEMADKLSREDRNLLCSRLSERIAADFTPAEIAEIKRAVAVADAEFERGDCLTSQELRKELGL